MIKETKEMLEERYSKEDPWGYQTNIDDAIRKKIILQTLEKYGTFERAIDLCCGEGWITKDLPAKEIFGTELSDKAASRFPSNVKRVLKPEGKYDLVVATGCLYDFYEVEELIRQIKEHASKIVLLCNITAWETPLVSTIEKQLESFEFPYREYIERIRVYDVSSLNK